MKIILFWGVFAIGAAYLAHLVYNHGIPWVWRKIKSMVGTVAGWFGDAKAEVLALHDRVSKLESAVDIHIAGHLAAPAQPNPPTPGPTVEVVVPPAS